MVYVDLVLILNIWLDFLIILIESLILKRQTSIKKIIFSSIVGSLSTFLLFFKISSELAYALKFTICLIMCLIAFNFKNLKYFIENILYFYLISIILAGFIYLIKENIKIDSFELNFLLLMLITPIFLYIYYKKIKKVDNHYNHLHDVKLYYQGKVYNFIGFLDTGNKLYDQYKHRPIIIVYTTLIPFDYSKGILVPYETASGKSLLKCLISEKVIIDNNLERKNVVFGLTNEAFKIENVDLILHNDIMGG